MRENLLRTLPVTRHDALREQLDLLDRTLPVYYKPPEGVALAHSGLTWPWRRLYRGAARLNGSSIIRNVEPRS